VKGLVLIATFLAACSSSDLATRMTVFIRETVLAGDVFFDLHAKAITRNDLGVKLTPTAFRLARIFLSNVGTLSRRESLLLGVWGVPPILHSRRVDVQVSELRRALRKIGAAYDIVRSAMKVTFFTN